MSDTLLTQLTALLAKWNDLAAESASRVPTADNPIQGGFYTGVMYGAEVARDELAAIVAEAMKRVTED